VFQSKDNGSSPRLPANFSPVYTRDAIDTRVEALGEEINRWCDTVWRESHTDVLTLPVMRGAIFFFSDLARAISESIEIVPIRTQAYETGSNGVMTQEVSIDIDSLAVKGRAVLVVDDVCDSGRTLEALEKALYDRGAREVRTAVLIRRLLDKPSFVPCWVGFEYKGPEWFVGYGMDDDQRWRNLDAVHIIKRDA